MGYHLQLIWSKLNLDVEGWSTHAAASAAAAHGDAVRPNQRFMIFKAFPSGENNVEVHINSRIYIINDGPERKLGTGLESHDSVRGPYLSGRFNDNYHYAGFDVEEVGSRGRREASSGRISHSTSRFRHRSATGPLHVTTARHPPASRAFIV